MRDKKKQRKSAFIGCGDHIGDKLWQVGPKMIIAFVLTTPRNKIML